MKKYLNILLIIVLVVVWGSIVYKFVPKEIPITGYERSSIINNLKTTGTGEKKGLLDTFDIVVGSRDPFLDKAIIYEPTFAKLSENTFTNTGRNQNKNSKKNWPSILYIGYVQSDGKSSTALIRVNEKLYRKKVKDTFDGLTLLQKNKDSILVELEGGYKKYFVKKD